MGMLVGMYLRVTSRTNADGSVVRYVALAHNERTGGRTAIRGRGSPARWTAWPP